MHQPRQLGLADAYRLGAVTGVFRSIDVEWGGGSIYSEIDRLVTSASALVDWTDDTRTHPAFLSSLVGARQLAGWAAFDTGRHDQAWRQWQGAERAAVFADQPLLVARVRYDQARLLQLVQQDRDALGTLRYAQSQLSTDATPGLTALLIGAEARSLAALGDAGGAEGALRDALVAIDAMWPEQEPEWLCVTDQRGEAYAQHAWVYRELARHDPAYRPKAVKWSRQAITRFEDQGARSRLLNEAVLCSSLALAGEPEESVSVGLRLVDQLGEVASSRLRQRVRTAAHDLVPYRAQPDVADFIGTVSAAVPQPMA